VNDTVEGVVRPALQLWNSKYSTWDNTITHTCSYSHTHTLTHSLALSHTHTHTHSHTHSLTHIITYTHPPFLPPSLPPSLTHSLTFFDILDDLHSTLSLVPHCHTRVTRAQVNAQHQVPALARSWYPDVLHSTE
jgi:hypothetical protein